MKSKVKNTFRLIVTLLLFAGWLLAASALHVIRTGNGVVLLPKDRVHVKDTYVNLNTWTADDIGNHPVLVKRLLATGKADLLAPAMGNPPTQDELVALVNDKLAAGPTTQPAPNPALKVVEKVEQAVQSAKAAVQ